MHKWTSTGEVFQVVEKSMHITVHEEKHDRSIRRNETVLKVKIHFVPDNRKDSHLPTTSRDVTFPNGKKTQYISCDWTKAKRLADL